MKIWVRFIVAGHIHSL